MDTKEISFPDSNRVGKFNVLHEVLRSERGMIGALLGLCTLIESGPHESGRGIEFIAAGPLFQELAEGEEIPEYRIEMSVEPFENPEREAARTNSGRFGFVAIRKTVVRVPAASMVAQARRLQ
jgi:hypothetical protein